MGLKTTKTPYQAMWAFIPMMCLPSVVITALLYWVIARWQPQFGYELNWATAKIFGCGCGVLFHFGCWLMGAFTDDFKAVKTRWKEFGANLMVSFRFAVSWYWEDVKTLGLAFWIDVGLIVLNAGIFVDAILDFVAIRGI